MFLFGDFEHHQNKYLLEMKYPQYFQEMKYPQYLGDVKNWDIETNPCWTMKCNPWLIDVDVLNGKSH